MEVRHDLDVEAAQSAESLGLAFARAATPGTRPRFASMITELVRERLALPEVQPAALGTMGVPSQVCPADCCRYGPVTAPAHRAGGVRGRTQA
jgi:ferrochelatase